jgi:hypothetical protein
MDNRFDVSGFVVKISFEDARALVNCGVSVRTDARIDTGAIRRVVDHARELTLSSLTA